MTKPLKNLRGRRIDEEAQIPVRNKGTYNRTVHDSPGHENVQRLSGENIRDIDLSFIQK